MVVRFYPETHMQTIVITDIRRLNIKTEEDFNKEEPNFPKTLLYESTYKNLKTIGHFLLVNRKQWLFLATEPGSTRLLPNKEFKKDLIIYDSRRTSYILLEKKDL